MNKERILELANAIETMEQFPFDFDMNDVKYCIRACALYIHDTNKYRIISAREGYSNGLNEIAADALGITKEQMHMLFYPFDVLGGKFNATTSEHAAQALRIFVDTDGAHAWDEIAVNIPYDYELEDEDDDDD